MNTISYRNIFRVGLAVIVAVALGLTYPRLRSVLYNAQGKAEFDKHNLDAAISLFDKAITADPDNKTAYHNRGLVYSFRTNYSQAIADFDKAISIDPQFAAAYLSRCEAYRNLHHYHLAMADCNQSIKLEPDRPVSYFIRGIVYLKQDDCPNATADFQKAVDLDPNNNLIMDGLKMVNDKCLQTSQPSSIWAGNFGEEETSARQLALRDCHSVRDRSE